MKVPERTRRRIAELLGREPRGLEEVAVTSAAGEPMVIRVAPLVDDKPFPTLFWLVDPALSYRIDRAEASGLIKRLQRRVDEDPQLQDSMKSDNLAYMRLRERYTDEATARRLGELGFANVFERKGVGGIGDFTRIRCLHTWYAAHLVVPNTVGALLDEWWLHNPDASGETGVGLDDRGAPD